MKECGIHFDVSIVADEESAEVAQPREGSFDFPSPSISPQLSPILRLGLLATGTMRTNQLDTAFFQAISQWIGVGGPVVNQPRRFAAGSPTSRSRDGDLPKCFLDQRDFVGGGRVEVNSQRNTLAVDHHHPLCTLAAFGFSDACAPFFAEANEPSAKVSSQFNRPPASSSPRKVRQILSHRPCSSQSRRRRQQVLEEGKSLGKSFHLAPLRNTQRMPSRHVRLSAGGRPPRLEALGGGNNGRIFSHCESVSSLLVMANPFAYQVNHKLRHRANLVTTRF